MALSDIEPDYQNGILNLTSALAEKMGVECKEKKLEQQNLQEIDDSATILFMVLDGLGYNYLVNHGSGLWLRENLVSSISSVFPPSTGSAMTTFYTASAPISHGITGWYVYLKKIGAVTRFLPYTTLVNDIPIEPDITSFIGSEAWLKKVERSVFVAPNRIIHSPYSKFASKGSIRIGYQSLRQLFGKVRNLTTKSQKRQFVFVYYPDLDAIAHEKGIESQAALKELVLLDKNLEKLAQEVPDNVRIIITADHGLVDIHKESTVLLGNHPELKKMLIAPVCGDTRSCYFYIRPNKSDNFQSYMKDNLSYACTVCKSSELVQRGWFGRGNPSKEFDGRVGDFVAIMKERYALLDRYPGQDYPDLVGQHGGVSEQELLVPLIIY